MTRNSWVAGLTARPVQTSAQPGVPMLPAIDPITALRDLVIYARSTGQIDPAIADKFDAAITRMATDGLGFEKAMGWTPGRGGRHKTPRARLVRAARTKVIYTLIAPLLDKNRNEQAEAVFKIVNGEKAALSVDAHQALANLKAVGGALPRSKSGVYTLIADVILAK